VADKNNLTAAVPAIRRPRLTSAPGAKFALPRPDTDGGPALATIIAKRRSCRDFAPGSVSLPQLASLLWSAQGITGLGGLRTAPSAGAIYPLRTYVLAADVDGLPPGFYRHDPDLHQLELLQRGDKRRQLAEVALGQECVEGCALAVLLAADYRRIVRELGDSGRRLACMEAGHAGQNFLLTATVLGLGAIGLGRFDSDLLTQLLKLPSDEDPLYLLLAGLIQPPR
jgi:SagB-type dehydrogenase family enzyme